MTIYKQPGSPYYYYDFYFEGRRHQASTHLRSKAIAQRVECIKKAELAQRRAGIRLYRAGREQKGVAVASWWYSFVG